MADDARLRIAPGLLFTVDADGTPRVWQPRRREHTPLPPELLGLLLQFGDGRTIADAAERAALELDDSVREAAATLLARELLQPAISITVPPRPAGTARARIARLVDRDSFVAHAEGPIVTGLARIDERPVALAAWEPGAEDGIEDVLRLQEHVLAAPCPMIYLLDLFSIGRRAADFIGARAIGRIYANQARLSGLAPQLAIVEGALWRPSALLPVGCDAVIFVEGAGFVHIADSELVKELTGEDVTRDALGGARVHAELSGLGHLVAASSVDAAALVRRYLAFMPAHAHAALPVTGAAPPPAMSPEALDALVPADADTPFAIGDLVRALADEGSPLELRPRYARELSTTLARIAGIPVGIVANCSQHKAGILATESSDKAARFITLCDAYGLPVLFLVDVLGFAIGTAAERSGIERAAGRVFQAIVAASVPKLTVAVRRAHTAGLFAMAGPAFDPDAFYALPSASLSVMSERALVPGAAALERVLDGDARASLRAYLRESRVPPEAIAEHVVPASQLRRVLATKLRELLAAPRPRARRWIAP